MAAGGEYCRLPAASKVITSYDCQLSLHTGDPAAFRALPANHPLPRLSGAVLGGRHMPSEIRRPAPCDPTAWVSDPVFLLIAAMSTIVHACVEPRVLCS